MSRKSSKSTSSTSNTFNTQNLALDGVEGVTLVGDGSVTITDANATEQALGFGGAALNFADDAVMRTLDFGGEALDFADRSTMRALGLVADGNESLLNHLSESQDRALNITKGALSTVAAASNDGQAALKETGKLIMLMVVAMAAVAIWKR